MRGAAIDIVHASATVVDARPGTRRIGTHAHETRRYDGTGIHNDVRRAEVNVALTEDTRAHAIQDRMRGFRTHRLTFILRVEQKRGI